MKPSPRRDATAGIAAVEFAISAPILLMLAGAFADFGLAYQTDARLAAAVSTGADYAFVQAQANGGAVSTTAVVAAVTAALGLNGARTSASSPGLFCPSDAGSVTSLVPGTAGTACADGSFPGTYTTISVSYTYQPLVPLYSMLAPTTLSVSGTVRLQ